jgi:predicted O-linked N-acetylglucosamine transferase (SPINDLY family)
MALPDEGFVFAAMAAEYKITPEIFAIWMRLLHSVAGSVLWLRQTRASAEANLKRAAEANGIAPERLVFAPWVAERRDHLARLRAADLFLDTTPYGAHSTAADALDTGLPVLALIGESFASRVAASLLSAAGLPELIASSGEEYAQIALRLAQEPELLSRTRDRLVKARAAGLLAGAEKSCRAMEAAYVTMWERNQKGLPPAHFAVSRG